MEDKLEKEAEENLKYLEMDIQRALGVPSKSKYGESLVSRVFPLLMYKEKLEEALRVYRERLIPKQT